MMQAPRTHALLTMLLACLGCTAAMAGAASAKPLFGVQGVTIDEPAAQTAKDMRTIARTGAKLVRVQVYWSKLERERGRYDDATLAALDRTMAAARRNKLKVVLFTTATPCWVSSAPASAKAACQPGGDTPFSVNRHPPSSTEPFVAFSTFLVQRYAKALAAYQIWNEPDQVNEAYWAGPDKVHRYVDLVKAAYPPLKAVAPRLPILAGSFVGTDGAWLKAMYDEGIKGSYDGLAVHFYDLPLYALRNTRAIQRANGDRTPQWLMEFGWDSCYTRGGPSHRVQHPCLTQRGQARAARDVLRAIRRTSWLKAAVLYQIRDENRDYRFGLFTRDGRAKPLLTSVKAALRTTAAAPLRPKLKLRVRHGRAVLTGTASVTDLYAITADGAGLRYTAYARTDRFGELSAPLPRALGTTGLRVVLRSTWSGVGATVTR